MSVAASFEPHQNKTLASHRGEPGRGHRPQDWSDTRVRLSAGPVGTEIERLQRVCAAQCAAIGGLQQRLTAAEQEAATLQVALQSSRRIGAAIGIIMATTRVTEEQAFDVLWRASQGTNRKLREIADDVLLTGDVPGHTG